MPSVHLKYGPSSAARWLTCPASLLAPKIHITTSEAASEGTAAHSLCQRCWLLGCDPEDLRGEEIEADGRTFIVGDEMIEGARLYLDTIEAHMTRLGASADEVRTEAFLVHPANEDFGGTADVLICSGGELVVIDYKFGMFPVEVENNPQLMCYALLALAENAARDPKDPNLHRITDVRVVVVQPRAHHVDGPVRSWEVDSIELCAFGDRVIEALTAEPDETFAAGDHCKFCPRETECPELFRLSSKVAAADFDAETKPPAGPLVDVNKVAEILNLRAAIKSYLKRLEDYAEGLLEQGTEVPGFKLVDSFGNRRYCVDESTVLRKCRAAKFGKKQIYKTELMSPAQLEKVVGKELVGSLVERPHSGTTLVPETDRRPAVVRPTAEDVFKGCESNG